MPLSESGLEPANPGALGEPAGFQHLADGVQLFLAHHGLGDGKGPQVVHHSTVLK